jgi:hypothetical protein
MTRRNPRITIEMAHLSSGTWWFASIWIHRTGIVTSGYWRKRDTAVRKLKAALRDIDSDLNFACGFLGGF